MRWASVLLLVAACGTPDKGPQGGDPCDFSPLTWQTTGRPYLTTWCTPCHSTTVPASERQGAPLGVDFDSFAGTLEWSERIGVRTGGEAAMPPSGGPQEDEVRSFQTWLACGLPGGTDEVVVRTCDAPTLVDGPVLASSDPCAAGDGVAVGGDLQIDVDADLSCICSVDGTVQADGVDDLVVVALPAMQFAGAIAVAAVPSLEQLDLSGLEAIGGSVSVTGTGLQMLDLSAPRAIGGALEVRDHPELVEVRLHRLATVGGSLTVAASPALSMLAGTTGVTEVAGSIVLQDLPALAHLDDFAALVSLGGDVVVQRTGLLSFNGLHRLTHVPGSILVEYNPVLAEARGLPDLLDVGGDFTLIGLPQLSTWEGLVFVTDIGGTLAIEDNDTFANLPLFTALSRVGGDMRVRNNRLLPTIQALFLAGRVTVEGQVVIEGNQL